MPDRPAGAATLPITVFLGSHHELHVVPPRVERGPVIDGRLEDPVWSTAAVLDSFTQGVPIEGVPDSLGTQCLVLYDAKYLYIGFRCPDDPRRIQSPVTRRDNTWQGDYVCASIDGFGDHQRSQFFCTNASGIQMDGVDADTQDDSDLAPDFLYAARGSRDARGWEAEMAIPFTSLRFAAGDTVAFGFNASRLVKRADSNLFWAPVTRNINSFHAQMGTLESLAGLRPGRNLQLNPALTATRSGARDATGDVAYADERRLGLGVKYGVSSALTADATVSPDFSQVEADASVIDVNERFAIYFPEKRPFFLEGGDIFHSPSEAVYTRQIVDPRFGGKMSGKLGRTSIGAIFAADRAAGSVSETIPDALNPYRGHDAYASIVRLKRDVLANSFVGLLATAREQRDAFGRDFGLDGRVHVGSHWSVSLQQLQSWSRGREVRPAGDAPVSAATLDSLRAAYPVREGNGSSTTLDAQRSGERLDAGLKLVRISPGFTADLGYVPRTDITDLTGFFKPHLLRKTPGWYTGFHPIGEFEVIDGYGRGLQTGAPADQFGRIGLEVDMPRATYAGVGYRRVFTASGGERFPGQNVFEFWGGSNRWQVVRADWTFRAGDNVLFDELARGRFWALDVTSDLRFSEQFDGALSLRAEVDRRRSDGSRFAEVAIPRLRVSYQFTKELAVRTITEWNSERRWDPTGAALPVARRLSLDGLISYALRPGTVAYLGYGSGLEGETPPALVVTHDNLFLKLSYLWQQ